MRMSSGLNTVSIPVLLLTLAFAAVVASGCVSKPPEGIWVNYSVNISVVDENGINVHDNPPIYDIDGVLSNTSTVGFSKSSGAGVAINGSSYYTGSTWPVAPGSYMVFGASTDDRLLNEDWDKRRFSPGDAGPWTVLTYDDITRNTTGRQNATLHVDIMVLNATGKMVKRPQAVTYGTRAAD